METYEEEDWKINRYYDMLTTALHGNHHAIALAAKNDIFLCVIIIFSFKYGILKEKLYRKCKLYRFCKLAQGNKRTNVASIWVSKTAMNKHIK